MIFQLSIQHKGLSMSSPLFWPSFRYGNVLLKITKEQHARALLRGEVFMNTLHSFSALANESPKIYAGPEVKTSKAGGIEDGEYGVQIDECEGAIRFFDLDDLPPDFKMLQQGAPENIKSRMQSAFYLEENTLPYLHLYCLYMLRYDTWTERFIDVDPQLRGFGDTAVLFIDPVAFFTRLRFAIMKECNGCCHIEGQPVEYLPETDRTLWNQFCKRDIFKWQNEYRVSAGGLDVPDYEIPESDSPSQHMIRDLKPWKFNVGDLVDCAVAFPLESLLQGALPDHVQELFTQRAITLMP